MKRFDILKMYSEIVCNYLSKGYIIRANDYSHQADSELNCIDLCLPYKEIIRITRSVEYIDIGTHALIRMQISIFNIKSNDEMQMLKKYAYYAVPNASYNWYFESMEEAISAMNKTIERSRCYRYTNSSGRSKLINNSSVIDYAYHYAKRFDGYKSIRKSDIIGIEVKYIYTQSDTTCFYGKTRTIRFYNKSGLRMASECPQSTTRKLR